MTHVLIDRLNRTVDAAMEQSEFSSLVLDLEHVDYHCRRIATELYIVGNALADAVRAEQMARHSCKAVEGRVLLEICNRLKSSGESIPKDAILNAMVSTSQDVIDAHARYADASRNKRRLEALYAALERKAALLLGFQRRHNQEMEMEAMADA